MWTDANGLHIVYSVYTGANDHYETYYKRSDHSNTYWEDSKTVTDEQDVYGGLPTVTTSANRVHVAFTDTYTASKTRDKYNGTWQTSQTTTTWYPEYNQIITTSSKLHSLYTEIHVPYLYLYYRNRDLSGSSWSSESLLVNNTIDSESGKPDIAVTVNDKLHMVFYYYGNLYYREWDGSLSSNYSVMSFEYAPRISSNSNDIYVTGITDDGSGGYELKMRQRDFAPLAPTGLSVASSAAHHPYITWSANKEADLKQYKVYKRTGSGSWSYKATATNTYYEDTSENIVHSGQTMTAYYKLKAEDQTNNLSPYSDDVSIDVEYEGLGLGKGVVKTDSPIPGKFSLHNNYPNPFNPSTNIQFDLPEVSHVQLRVYNIQGKMVSQIVNQNLPAGNYNASFNASGLPSGIYIYQLIAGEFKIMKRMLLIK